MGNIDKQKKFYKSNLLAKTAKVIPYNKSLRNITGSVTAAILFQQLEYWFDKTEGRPFYKFTSKPKTDIGAYNEGDSWTEELGFSVKEFRVAFNKIGIAHKSRNKFNEADDIFKGKMYCSYYNRTERATYYLRNSKMVNDNIELCLNPELSETTKGHFQKLPKGISRNDQREFPLYTENTTETTSYIIPSKSVNFDDEKNKIKKNKLDIFVLGVSGKTALGRNAPSPIPLPPSPIQKTNFDIFWKAYPRKVGKKKAKAIYTRCIKKNNRVAEEILKGLEKYNHSWKAKRTQKQFIPHPTTWLNEERWTDDIETEVGQAYFQEKRSNDALKARW